MTSAKTPLILFLTLILLVPPFLIFVGQPSPLRSMETICMQTSMETWMRLHEGETDAWWTPSWDGGVTRIEKPPLLVWLNLFAWRNLDPETATMEQLSFGARGMTISVILLGLAGLFWIGLMLKNRYVAMMSALITGTMFLLVKQSHYATYDAQLMGWATFAVACGVRAINPMNRSYRFSWTCFFWLLSGLFLGAAMMTKGPVASVWVIAPLALLVALTSKNRWRNALGVLGCLLIGAVLMVPWFRHTMAVQAGALASLADEYKPVDTDQFRPMYYYASIIVLVFPWTFWWIPSLIAPFRKKKESLVRFFPLAWFLLTFIFLCAWPMRHQRYLVPLLPAVGLMTAMYISGLVGVESKRNRSGWLTGFWVLALLGSVLVPLFVPLQPWLVSLDVIDEPELVGIHPVVYVSAAIALLAVCYAGLKSVRFPLQKSSFVLIAVWMVGLMTFAYSGYSLAWHQRYDYLEDTTRLASLAAERPIYFQAAESQPRPDPGLEMYTMKMIRPINVDEVAKRKQAGEPFALLVPEQATTDEPVTTIYDGDTTWKLFLFDEQ